MEVNSNLFNTPYWRFGRWVVVIATVLLFTLFSVTPSYPATWIWVWIIGSIIITEIVYLLPKLQTKATPINLINDAVIIAILGLGYREPMVSLLYLPLLTASISLAIWRLPLLLTIIATALYNIVIFYFDTTHSIMNIIFINGTLLIIGGVSSWLAAQIAKESLLRNQLMEKLDNHSDHFLMYTHDLRTPLALIRASVELILGGAPGPLTKQQQIFLENIDESSQRVTLLAENILAQSKLESGIFQPSFRDIDIRVPVRATVKDMRVFAARQNQQIQTHYPKVLPLISADIVLLRQALTNLLQNALEHTLPDDTIIVSVAKNDFSILISVTDGGAGMSAEHRQKIFERFATAKGGTGLGLAIVKQIIELHQGKVLVTSTLGRGTTFLLTLPLTQP